jgi:hypothetical protein
MKTKQQKIATMCKTSDYWKTTEGVKVIVKKYYWFNGEVHLIGVRLDNNEIVDLPDMFFN